jgi:hypothetical protein
VFNALKYTEELKRAGFSADQAEISVKVLIDAMNDNFATRSDLTDLKVEFSELRADFSGLRAEFSELRSDMNVRFERVESSMRELEYKLTIKLGTMMGTMLTLAIGLTAMIVRFVHAS